MLNMNYFVLCRGVFKSKIYSHGLLKCMGEPVLHERATGQPVLALQEAGDHSVTGSHVIEITGRDTLRSGHSILGVVRTGRENAETLQHSLTAHWAVAMNVLGHQRVEFLPPAVSSFVMRQAGATSIQ